MTESEASEQLERSVAKSLFLGNILEDSIFPYPEFSPEDRETIQMVVDSVGKFLEGKHEEFKEYDKVGEQPDEYLNSLKELGLFGIVIPEEYGGLGFGSRGYARVVSCLGEHDASTSLTIGAHSSIGLRGLLLFGNDEQKGRYFEKLATGEMIAAFCLTEPGSGSDVASMKSSASKNEDGSWTLNGEKIWITNGAFADFFTVFARTEGEKGKLSAFIVERSFEGVSTGPKEDKMGIRASATTTVHFNNVRIPPENVLGEEGKGFKMAMEILNTGRTGLGGGCVGAMKFLIGQASEQAANRKQFGRPIAEFGLIKEKIAQMTVDCYTTESLVYMIGSLIDRGSKDYSMEAGMTKIYATEALWRVADEALQIAGGNGYMKEYPYEMAVRDCRINRIFEGTNEILRLFVGLSGMKEAGRYLKEIGEGTSNIFNDPIKGFGLLSDYATKKISQLTPLGRDKLDEISPELRDDAEVFESYTQEFSRAVESVLRKHGKEIIGKQFATKRLADTAIDLFVGLSTLSRVDSAIKRDGAEKARQERDILRVFSQSAKRRMNQNLRRIDKNEDELMKGLSDFIVSKEGYPWDMI